MKLKLSNIYIIIPIAIVGFVFATIQISTSGSQLAAIESKKASLLAENEQIKRELVKSSSLTKLSTESEGLGYVNTQSTFFIKSSDVFAKLP